MRTVKGEELLSRRKRKRRGDYAVGFCASNCARRAFFRFLWDVD